MLLAHQVLHAGDARPERLMLFLHGILGRGQNWRSIARRFIQARPDWGAVLVDLRLHGQSRDVPGPHTLDAAAGDLDDLARALDRPVRGVLGHSFGGKVALAWVARRTAAASGADLDTVWLVDSPPGARPTGSGSEEALELLDSLAELEGPFNERRDFVREIRGRGFSEALGMWLATNLVRNDRGAFELGLDIEAIREILDDYFARDLWPQVEAPKGHHALHLVVGGRSDVFSAEDRKRAAMAAESNPRVHLHVIEDAGHWVHVDAPDELCNLLKRISE